MEYRNKFDDPNYMFTYDEAARCCLRWKNSKRHPSLVGQECGTLNKYNHTWAVQFRGSPKLAHRVVWEMFHGKPEDSDTIEFLDGDQTNVKIGNLRLVEGKNKNWQDKYLKAKELDKVFTYKNGNLYWVGDRYSGKGLNKKYACDGDLLKSVEDKDGYLRTKLVAYRKTGQMQIHRLVYEYFNGPIPEGMQIDHIDGDVKNNHIENLRCVKFAVNSRNRKIGSRNSSGILGVGTRYYNGDDKYYRAFWRNAEGIEVSKSFSCNKYGDKKALDMAIEARHNGIRKTNEALGSEGYHENHGKRS